MIIPMIISMDKEISRLIGNRQRLASKSNLLINLNLFQCNKLAALSIDRLVDNAERAFANLFDVLVGANDIAIFDDERSTLEVNEEGNRWRQLMEGNRRLESMEEKKFFLVIEKSLSKNYIRFLAVSVTNQAIRSGPIS